MPGIELSVSCMALHTLSEYGRDNDFRLNAQADPTTFMEGCAGTHRTDRVQTIGSDKSEQSIFFFVPPGAFETSRIFWRKKKTKLFEFISSMNRHVKCLSCYLCV